MHRRIALVLVLASAAGCSSGGGAPSPTAPAPTVAPAPTATTAATPSPSRDPLEPFRIAYQKLWVHDQAVITDRAMNLSAASGLAGEQAALSELAMSASTFERDMAAIQWAPVVTAQADAVIAAIDEVARLARAASTGDSRTISSAMPHIERAVAAMWATIATLEAALGIHHP